MADFDPTSIGATAVQPQSSGGASSGGFDPASIGATPITTPSAQSNPSISSVGQEVQSKIGSNPLGASIPEIPAPFKESASDNGLLTAAKTIGNLPSDTVNLATGVINFLNPFKNIGSIINNVKQTYQDVSDYAKQTNQSPVDIFAKSLVAPSGQNIPGTTIDTSALGANLYKAVVPQFLQSLLSGDTAGATKTLVENPATSIGPILLVASGAADQMGMKDQFDEAMNKVANPLGIPIANTVEAAVKGADEVATKVGGAAKEITANTAQQLAKNDWAKPGEQSTGQYTNANEILQNEKARGNDIADRIVKSNIKLSDNTDNINGRRVFNTADTAQQIREATMKASNEALRPSLEAANSLVEKIPVKDVLESAKRNINSNNSIPAEKQELLKSNIDNLQSSMEKKYPDGMSLTDLHDEKIIRDKNSKYSPVGDIATNNEAIKNKAIADASRKTLEQNAPEGVPVEEVNAEYEKNFKMADYLDALDGKSVPKSILGTIAKAGVQAGGAMLGDTLGIGGAFAGYSLGGVLSNMLQNVPTSLRDSLLNNLSVENPEAFAKMDTFLKQVAIDKETLANTPPEYRGITKAQWRDVVNDIHRKMENTIRGGRGELPPLSSVMKKGTFPNESLNQTFPEGK